MKKIISCSLILLLCPAVSFAGSYNYPVRHGMRPYGYHYYPPPSPGIRHQPYPRYNSYHHHHNDWILPLAIVGTALGVMALSQSYTPPPLPPQRICRDTYNYYDENGRYLYSEYVDRPCN